MLIALGRGLTIGALCLSLGFHWLALQSVAWTTMLVANARHAPLSEAVAKTFDGSHPCDLCHVVAEGKKTEKKSQFIPTISKMDLFCATQSFHCLPPWIPFRYAAWPALTAESLRSPPVPPPRLLG